MKIKVEIYDVLAEEAKMGSDAVDMEVCHDSKLISVGQKLNLSTDLIHVVMVNGQRQPWDYLLNENDYVQIFPTVGTTEAEVFE